MSKLPAHNQAAFLQSHIAFDDPKHQLRLYTATFEVNAPPGY
jgi:hypothetical protein